MNILSEFGILLLGWVVGLFIAMPVGPVAVLMFRRTLRYGWPAGVATGLGAAAADTFYAAIAAFGVYAVQEFLINHQYTLREVGGIALLFVGIRMLWQKSSAEIAITDITETDNDAWHRLLHSFMTSMFLTVANPLTLIAFLTIFTNFGITHEMHSYKDALVFVAGAALGAATWWLSLVGAVTLIKARISDTLIAKINSVLAVFLVAAGAYALISGYLEKPLGQLFH